jgi:hypothetical protein
VPFATDKWHAFSTIIKPFHPSMKKYLLALGAMAALAGNAHAETVVFSENFDGDYAESFPYIYDCDNLEPASNIRTLFIGTEGYYMPWWHLKDSSAATDRYICSHSHYTTAGTSNDWLGSREMTITSSGFTLSFDAQSYTLKGDNNQLSDLWVFITEEPLDKSNLPTVPFQHLEKISQGNSVENVEGDFTHYEFSLDQYVGKTIYINFANLNTDKDLLCLDNIKVARNDNAEIEVAYPSRITDDNYTVEVEISGINANHNWTVTLADENGSTSASGELLAAGEKVTTSLSLPIAAGTTSAFTVSFESDEQDDLSKSGEVSRLTFSPYRKVLVEETTGMWCGWCPAGINLIESMHDDEEMSQYVLPVSVHIYSDNLALDSYGVTGLNNGSTYAPIFYVNRSNVGGPSQSYDYNFDKTLKGSIAKRVVDAHETLTTCSIDVTAEWEFDGADTVAINCKATVRPALNIDYARYRIGFILTENNVSNANFVQTNSVHGTGTIEPWSSFDTYVTGLYYNEVARKIDNYAGITGSLPTFLTADTDYSYSHTLKIPDAKITASNGEVLANAIQCQFCTLTAFVIDADSGEILNAEAVPMSDVAEFRYTTAMYAADQAGVSNVTVDNSNAPAEYFDLQGRKVAHPANGIFIKRQGSTVTKVVM